MTKPKTKQKNSSKSELNVPRHDLPKCKKIKPQYFPEKPSRDGERNDGIKQLTEQDFNR